jgi:Xaa-Pro dipeptidase
MIPTRLSPESCKARRDCLGRELAAADIPAAIFSSPENVQYFSGYRPHWLLNSLLMIDATGHATLVAPTPVPPDVSANDIYAYDAQWHSTLRQDQLAAASNMLRDSIGDLSGRVGVESCVAASAVLSMLNVTKLANVIDISAILHRLRRRKADDEVEMIRSAIACTDAMYARAAELMRPGINELEMFSELHRTAVQVAGEPLTAIGNDYQCNSAGGLARDRLTQSGELYILDLGVSYRGYWADNCRTFAVDGKPTDTQLSAWEGVKLALEFVEETVRPGVSCRELFNQVQAQLDEHLPGAFCHHLGHGFGLFPHETPHLNPHWDDYFQEGDVFTAEPGLYYDELHAGIRLEENYRVSSDGVERLTTYPLELA